MALGHPISVVSFYGLQGGLLDWGGVPHFPGMTNSWIQGDPYARDIVGHHATHFRADVIMSLMDLWPLKGLDTHGIPFCPYFPIDMEPLAPPVRDMAAGAFKRIVFSRFGERMVNEAGLDCYYVPHAYNGAAYKPCDQREAREKLNLPTDAFIVGIVAANQGNPSRKSFNEMVEAFAEIKQRHPDALLYLHTCMGQQYGGVNLVELAGALGLKAKVDIAAVDQYQYLIGFPEEYMAEMYSAFDVLLNVSQGEGFGLTQLESQACGTPVINGDWTAMSELCLAGWSVAKEDATRWRTPLAAYQWIPRVGAIVEALEAAYEARGNRKLRQKAANKAKQYEVEHVMRTYWKPVLKAIEQALNERKQGGAKTVKLVVPEKTKLALVRGDV